MKKVTSTTLRQSAQAIALLAGVTILPSAHADESGALIMVTHKVQDFQVWKKVYDSTAAWKPGYGWKQGTVFSVDGDPNNVMVIEEFGSMDQAKTFAGSSELKAAMGKAGVMGPPEVRFVTSVARSKNQ